MQLIINDDIVCKKTKIFKVIYDFDNLKKVIDKYC